MTHPPMQPGWIDAPHRLASFGRFTLESGDALDSLRVSYVVHGSRDERGLRDRPVILALTAIGSTHHRLDFLVGEGRALDTSRFAIVVADALGNGLSSSPSNSPTQPGERFPRFTIRDMVASQRALCARLGIERLHAVVGASMGGMQALQWGVSHPDFVDRIVAMTPMAKTAPWARAINHAGREALAAASRATTPEARWAAWVAVMHVFAMRTPRRFARDAGADTDAWFAGRARWMAEQGADPLDWVVQSHAYDAHDVGTTPGLGGDTARALASIRARTLIAVPSLDLYNPVEDGVWAAEHLADCQLVRLSSDSGHMAASEADPLAAAQLNDAIGRFLRDAS